METIRVRIRQAPGRTVVALLVAAVGAGLLGPLPATADPTTSHPATAPTAADPATTPGIGETIRRMSLEEKVGQLFTTYVYGSAADTADARNRQLYGVDTPADVVRRYHLGGVIHFAWSDNLRNPRQIAELNNGLQDAALSSGAKVPLLVSTDQEQGIVTRFGAPATDFPGSMALGAARTAEAARTAAAITGRELRAVGINQNFAPIADVNVNPANPVIGVRSFGADPALVSDLVAAQVEGFESGRPWQAVSATAKHFPGHGDTNVDSHTSLPVIGHTREQWEELDAPPFRAAVAAEVDSIMTAHIVMPALDDSGEPATLSPRVLTGLLREELGFDGVVVTDSLAMAGVRQRHSDAEIPVLALKAGADVLLMPWNLPTAVQGVLDAVRRGDLTEQRIDQSLRRILKMKLQRAITSHPYADVDALPQVIGIAEHREAAARIADETVTALRDDAGLLPLDRTPREVLVTGWGETTTRTLADAMRRRGSGATAMPTGATPTAAVIDRTVAAAGAHDLVVVLTNRMWDVANQPQQRRLVAALAATGKPVVAVAVRDPYDAGHAEEVGTWLTTYSYAPVSVEALARVLHGEVGPRGRLPVDIPDPARPGVSRYPFGHGLTW
ncbi:glycoside hydrolase family 3 protein [Saccharothrix hoggarensis]|uniref:beta-N-acetylhexosaminidase n=1 Tax=Saccharothrix hoggarensis TaxID=913853 RepID=A0ABW3R0G1_9PSEU